MFCKECGEQFGITASVYNSRKTSVTPCPNCRKKEQRRPKMSIDELKQLLANDDYNVLTGYQREHKEKVDA